MTAETDSFSETVHDLVGGLADWLAGLSVADCVGIGLALAALLWIWASLRAMTRLGPVLVQPLDSDAETKLPVKELTAMCASGSLTAAWCPQRRSPAVRRRRMCCRRSRQQRLAGGAYRSDHRRSAEAAAGRIHVQRHALPRASGYAPGSASESGSQFLGPAVAGGDRAHRNDSRQGQLRGRRPLRGRQGVAAHHRELRERAAAMGAVDQAHRIRAIPRRHRQEPRGS